MLFEGISRGLSCLHCTQPEARTQANIIHRLLRQSCLQRISINYLVDGTFSFDPNYLIEKITELSTGGRQLSVTFFLANGAAQRRFDVTRIDSFATMINPEDFRAQIESDPVLQEEYRNIVRRLIPVLRSAASLGVSVSLIPYLEDNLSDRAFNVMLSVTQQEVPSDLPVAYGRNPCGPACFLGNEIGIPAGVFREEHTSDTIFDAVNGIVSNDGFDYASLSSPPNPLAKTCLSQLREIRDFSEASNNSFILWSGSRQGLPPDIDTQLFPLPQERNYEVPSEAEQVEIIEFLREGRE